MTVKQLRLEKVKVLASAQAKAHNIPSPVEEAPGGLYPIRFAAFQLDDYRMAHGWPVATPDHDIRATTLVSADGVTLKHRPDPQDVTTAAMVRWVANEDFYDTTSYVWTAFQRSFDLKWESTSAFAPTFVHDHEYRVGTERLYADIVNFDSDSREHMYTNMNGVIGGASGYTVIMVVDMNSVYGNNLDIPYSGIWCPGFPAPGGVDVFDEAIDSGWVSVTLQGQHFFVESEQTQRTQALPVSNLLSKTAPMYLALVMGRPHTKIYAGSGPSSITYSTTYTGDEQTPLTGNVVLGRSNGDVLHSADMGVMDIGLYPTLLSADEVRTEFSKLSASYGGDQ